MLASSFKERVLGRRVRTNGDKRATMAELSEIGVALSRMMDRRVIDSRGLAAALAERKTGLLFEE